MNIKRFPFLFYMVVALLGTSCIRENTDDCFTGIRLNFSFTLNEEELNKFGPDINRVHVYVFDSNGILQQIETEKGSVLSNDYFMDIPIRPGKYTLIAWAGSNEDFLNDNSFQEGDMHDAVTHSYTPHVTLGQTRIDDFRLMMKYNIADDLPEDIVPSIDELDELYYGAVGKRTPLTCKYKIEPVEVKYGLRTEREIELIKNTNILRLTVTGINNVKQKVKASSPLDVWAVIRNGRYKFDNTVGEYARTIRYTPHYTRLAPDSLQVDIKTIRLDMERHTAEPAYLYVKDPMTGYFYPDQPIDIVNTLLQARNPETGKFLYNSQEDFDRLYVHPIEIRLEPGNVSNGNDLRVRIFIKDWEIVNVVPAP